MIRCVDARLAVPLLLLWLLTPATVRAHGGGLAPGALWAAWNWEPILLAGLLFAGSSYGRGIRTLWARAGRGRGLKPWQAAAFTGGLLAVFVALISPLDALAGVLFSAHMAQHMLLVLVAPPLLILGRPELALMWALPAASRRGLSRWWQRRRFWRRLWHLVTKPASVWLLHALIFWLWHVPVLYEAALQVGWIHHLEHATFFASAALFWWTLARCRLRGEGLTYGLGILFVFSTALQGGLLGWLLTFGREPWYLTYAVTTMPWGLTPLEDQQLAGVMMWIPAGFVYALGALLLLGNWLQGLERQGRPSSITAD
jgi:putative membrane protein